jgi:hypothetical protein
MSRDEIKKLLEPYVGKVVSFFDVCGGCLDENLEYIDDWMFRGNDFLFTRILGKDIEIYSQIGCFKLKLSSILAVEEHVGYKDIHQIHITWKT